MKRALRAALVVLPPIATAIACGGDRQLVAAHAKAGPSESASAVVAPPPSGSSSTTQQAEAQDHKGWVFRAIGCWVGGAWSEALGAAPEERTPATTKRCRSVLTDALKVDVADENALSAMRSIDPSAVDRVAAAIEAGAAPDKAKLVALARASADASREAMAARRAANDGKASSSFGEALSAKVALAKLKALDAGPYTAAAKAIALMLAADHLEAARGLEPKGKILAATPAFEVIFGVPAPKEPTKPGDWLAFVSAAASAAGHAVDPSAGDERAREQAAFVGVAQGFADRLEAEGKNLPDSEVKDASLGYAKRLRDAIADLAKKKALTKPK